MTNWTAGFVSEEYSSPNQPMFRMYRLSVEDIPTAPGTLRAQFGDTFGQLIYPLSFDKRNRNGADQ
jgi:hypothetical protein